MAHEGESTDHLEDLSGGGGGVTDMNGLSPGGAAAFGGWPQK